MKGQIKTLILDSNGLTWKAVFADTVLRGFFAVKSGFTLPGKLHHRRLMRKLLGERNESLSYVMDWREAFCDVPELDVEVCNITNLVEYFRSMCAIAEYSLIIILHSATGDSMSLLLKMADWFNRRRGTLVVFIGNEYNLMPDKINFVRSVKADYICSQLPFEAAQWLYAECNHSKILEMPHALNPKLYYPNSHSRPLIDIGFIGDFYHNIIGDLERTNLIRYFQAHEKELGLICDIRNQRLPRKEWAHFLRTCKGILGAESGTYYLDRRSQTIKEVKSYLKKNPTAPFEELYSRFFKDSQKFVSGKAISSRHFEPIGTKTCQILIEGYYNGILMGDVHYISIKKDLSNIEEAIERFKDIPYREAMVNRTYEYVISEHTYRHRVETLLKAVVTGFP